MTTESARILLVEDEQPLRVGVEDSLRAGGYRVFSASDGRDGLEMAISEKPDLIVLDVMLPKLDGFAMCRELRRLGIKTLVLMLTARGLVEDRVKGLDSGADDYLVKPFSLVELHARIRALLRRTENGGGGSEVERVSFGDISVDLPARICRRNGKEVALTAKEFGVLQLLVENAGKPVSREQFLDLVWGYAAFPTTRTIDNHIARLRRKLESDPKSPRFILTVPKAGYKLSQAPL